VAGIPKIIAGFNGRASQQRVLLRIQTAFPFHCRDKLLQHQWNKDTTNLNAGLKLKKQI
jgi:hypothetical protein